MSESKTKKIEVRQGPAHWSDALGMNDAYGTDMQNRNPEKFGKHSTAKGAFAVFSVKINPDGRYATGIDPKSSGYNLIKDQKLRAKKIKEAEDNLKRLEAITGKDLDARIDNEYWRDLLIQIVNKNGKTIFDMSMPDQEIRLTAALASGIIAPSLDHLKEEAYRKTNCRFYIYDEVSEVSTMKINTLKRDELVSKLYNMKDNKEKLYYISRALDVVSSRNLSADDNYLILRNYVETIPTTKLDLVKDILNKDPQDLMVAVRVREGIERQVFEFSKPLKSFIFSGKPIGPDADAMIRFFGDTKNKSLFDQLDSFIEGTY